MTQQTLLTAQDLKFFPSERLTDNDDGGGMMLSTPLTNEPNELFQPISTIARVNGAFYARLVYMGLLRDDDAPIIGPHAIISKPPQDKNLSYLLFRAGKYGEQRNEVMRRIEDFAVATIESRLTLLSTQTKGSRIVQCYQRKGEPLPLVGTVFCLRQDKAGYQFKEQYIKVLRVDSEDRTFSLLNSGGEIVCTVVKLEISEPLRDSFVGVNYPSSGYVDNAVKVRETHIADGASYFGVKPLSNAVEQGDRSLKVTAIKEKLAPTTQAEIPLLDLNAAGQRPLLFDAARAGSSGIVNIAANRNVASGTALHVGNAIAPNSLSITSGSGEIKDRGNILRIGDTSVGTVDHARGELRFDSQIRINNMQFRPAAADMRVADTAAIDVAQQNRSFNYNITILPAPPPGALQVSYQAMGRWYDLRDDGSGSLTGLSEGHGSGSINYTSGTVNITCAEMPDIGSSILFTWSTIANFKNRAGGDIAAEMVFNLSQPPVPGSINLTWTDGSAKTASDDGKGNLTGDWTGKIDYVARQIRIPLKSGFNHPAGRLDVSASYQTGAPQLRTFSAPVRNADGTVTLDLGATNIPPGLLNMRFNLKVEDYDDSPATGDSFQKNWVIQHQDVKDNGAGKLVTPAGVELGTIDYAVGKISFNPNVSVPLQKPRYRKIQVGFRQPIRKMVLAGNHNLLMPPPAPTYRNVFSHYDSIPAAASLPIDASALIEVTFYAGNTGSSVSDTLQSGTVEIDLLPYFAETIVPNSLSLYWSGKHYFDRRGELYTDLNISNGSATKAGTLNNQSGVAVLELWDNGWIGNAPQIKAMATTISGNPVDEVVFRVPATPIRPASLQLVATPLTGGKINVRATADGKITGAGLEGTVDVQSGVVRVRFGKLVDAAGKENEEWYNPDAVKDGKIWQPLHVFAETITYSAIAYQYLPVATSVVKINAVRMPQDGRVPIFRVGDTVVISNAKTDDIGSAHTQGQTVQLSRKDVDRLCIRDATGTAVNAQLWDYDLDAGTITWKTPLDLSAYTMPLSVRHTQEERNRITVVDIDGTLTLQFALKRAYPVTDTYVSSAVIDEMLQVRATEPFTQRNFSGQWQDTPQGSQLLNRLNTKDYPIVLNNAGTITDRWLIRFTAANIFELYSETLGFVTRADTLQDLAPLRPHVNKPYFVIKKQAFGADTPWAAQDVIRFNTVGGQIPLWIIGVVNPNADTQETDQTFEYCLLGETTKI